MSAKKKKPVCEVKSMEANVDQKYLTSGTYVRAIKACRVKGCGGERCAEGNDG